MNLNLTKVHTQGIPLIEGGSLFLSERAYENLITSSDLWVGVKQSAQTQLSLWWFSFPKTNFYFQSKKKKIWTIEYARMLIPHKHEKCVIDLLKFSLRRHLFY